MSDFRIKPMYQIVDGIQCPMFPPKHLREAMNYKVQPGDIFVTTYPKCGTTWMQSVALYIFRKGRELEDPMDFHWLSPFIDARGVEGITNMPRPGTFKTHFPRTRIPYSPEAKYLYVIRNPKDCCVSMYHHIKITHYQDHSQATFDDFFEMFLAGDVIYGDYFDHIMSWYPHLKDQQVFFTTYEDMQKDLRAIVLRLLPFLGQEYVEAVEKDNNVLRNILHLSSFEYMKKNYREFVDLKFQEEDTDGTEGGERQNKPPELTKNFHVRKGIVGDWVNYFSEEQSNRLSRKFEERTKGTEIFEIYRDRMGL